MVVAYIGLGSNLDQPQQQLNKALKALAETQATELTACSPFYRSKAVGPGEQPDYLNAVCSLNTTLPPRSLLKHLHAIENAQGRVRNERWGARTLDLDILLYGELQINTPTLHIPHPRINERNFVLYPLFDIAPKLTLPSAPEVSIESLLAIVGDADLTRIEPVHAICGVDSKNALDNK